MSIFYFITWYAALLVLGIIGLPFSNFLFRKWGDRGYAFSKIIGIFFSGIILWTLSSFKILPFNSVTAYILVAILFIFSLYYLKKIQFKVTKNMVITEILFVSLLAIWAFIRSTNPRAEGTEKFMNLAFMNSINDTSFFPPRDPWFEGGTINYYYFGHYLWVFVSKLSRAPIGYAYNLALISTISIFATSVFSILSNLVKTSKVNTKLFFSAAAAGVLSFGANLHYAASYINSSLNGEKFDYYFPNPTRIIPFTINEFPSYSIILGDLHPHYMALPFLTLVIGFSIASLTIAIDSKEKVKYNFLFSFVLVFLYAINSWDFITGLFILTILHIYQVFLLDKKLKQKVIHFTVAQLSLIVPGLVLIIPYILNFSPPVGGIGIVPLDVKSPITPWLQMWGMFLIIFAVYIILRLIKKINFDPEKLKLRTETWVFVLLLIGFALLIGVEFLFIKDIFFESNGDYFRTNTVFKFYYHVWVIWGVVAGYFAVKIFTDIKKNNVIINYLAFAVLGILSVFSVSYIDKAINDFYFNEKEKTLDGIAFIKDEYPNDYDAINWINENIQEQSIIAEAVGNAYTYYARISTTTGNQTVIGWPTHEWQWRGEPEPVFARQSRIQRLYESINEGEVTSIIKDFDIEYIYVGELEKSTYTDLTEKIFEDIGEIVYDENGTRIYKILE